MLPGIFPWAWDCLHGYPSPDEKDVRTPTAPRMATSTIDDGEILQLHPPDLRTVRPPHLNRRPKRRLIPVLAGSGDSRPVSLKMAVDTTPLLQFRYRNV